MEFSLPWLLLLGLVLPVALTVPLLMEVRRGRDSGPRKVPASTLKRPRRPRRASRRGQKAEDPKSVPGLTRVGMDLGILEGTEMEGNVVTEGRLGLAPHATLRGSGKARKGIHVGEGAKVFGNLITAGEVRLGRLSYVQGLVYANGNVLLLPGAVVKGIYTEGRVDVHPGAEILEDVIAAGGVHLVVPMEGQKAMDELELLNALLTRNEVGEDDE
ncbi:MAG: polymer-forming cytoskeletal protein [Thermoplasmata archaeon]